MPLKPPKYVDTIRRLIYWQYAQLIAKAAGFAGNYGFVISRYKKLESGEMSWSSSIRDYEKELETGVGSCNATSNTDTQQGVSFTKFGREGSLCCIAIPEPISRIPIRHLVDPSTLLHSGGCHGLDYRSWPIDWCS